MTFCKFYGTVAVNTFFSLRSSIFSPKLGDYCVTKTYV